MARFYGKVGYVTRTESETQPGVWKDTVTERPYFGDSTRISSHWNSADKVNDDIIINNQISILADGYAYQNFSAIKYVEWMGVKWNVSSIEVSRPRLILSLGDEYNG